jgi:glutathione peroxidase
MLRIDNPDGSVWCGRPVHPEGRRSRAPSRRTFVPSIYDIPINSLQGEPGSLEPYQGQTLLLVNVASKCGLTPQYEGLQKLQDAYGGRGFTVLGFPCNQFLEQEPGTPQEIAEFCSVNYGVTFPLFEKIEVNGPDRHPLYDELTAVPDGAGEAGDIQWNFEKFLVAPDGSVAARFRPQVEPEDAALVAAVEDLLDQR